MICPRCQTEMLSMGDLGFDLCRTEGCPISNYQGDENYYIYTLSFEKYPGIYIETGKKPDGYFTHIGQAYMDDLEGFTNDHIIKRFDQEMIDMTVERLQTILVFG